MHHFFEQHTFLECFDTEEISYLDSDECIEICTYTLTVENDCILSISMVPIEDNVIITFEHRNGQAPIFKLEFTNHTIDYVSVTNEKQITFLNLFKSDRSRGPFHDRTTDIPFLQIMIKPHVTLRLEW